jgi:hypothetical protein
MSAQFVARVLSYSLGRGNLSLKGRRQRPWLEISRSELEHTYLDHQSRVLRKLHDGPVDSFWDRIATNGFYDKERVRLQGEDLWRAYELLCPRDKKVISPTVLEIAGIRGMTALWLDQGRFLGKRGQIRGRYTDQEYDDIAKWLTDLGIRATPHRNNVTTIELILKTDALNDLIKCIRPLTHVSMKKKLRKARY